MTGVRLRYTSQRLQLIRSYYTGIGKTAVVYPAAFLVALSIGLVSLGIIFYARETFAAAPGRIGLMSALWSLAYIAGCLLLRPAFDRVLPRFLIILSAFLMALFFALALSVRSFSALVALYALAGLVMSLFWPPLMGWLARGMEGKTLGRLMARYNFAWSAGVVASPYLSGIMSERNPSLPLLAGSGLLLLTCILVTGASLALPKIRADAEAGVERGERTGQDRRTLLRYPSWVGLFTSYVAIGIILNIFPVAGRVDLGLGKGTVGLLLEGRILLVTVGFVVMGKTGFWHFRAAPMLAMQGVLGCVMVIMSLARDPVLLGALIGCAGFCMAVSYFYSMFHGISGSVNRSGMMALHEALLSAGVIAGSSAGGYIYQHLSMRVVYVGAALLVFAGLAVQGALSAWAARRERGGRDAGVRDKPSTGQAERIGGSSPESVSKTRESVSESPPSSITRST